MQFGPFREFAVDGDIPPSPSIYWNHGVREKLRIDLLESITCWQNPENKVVPALLCERSRSFLPAMIGEMGCGWQGQMSQRSARQNHGFPSASRRAEAVSQENWWGKDAAGSHNN
jgi:hypothetical protein